MQPIDDDNLRDAIAAMHRGDLEDARQLAEAVRVRIPREPRLYSLLGTIAARMGDLFSAVEYLQIALHDDSSDIGARVNLAKAFAAQSDFDEVLKLAMPGEADRDPSMALWRLRAYASLHLRKLDDAIAAYGRVIDRQPRDFGSLNNLGNARADQGDFGGAIEALNRAAALRPDNLEVRLNLAAVMGRGGEEENALVLLREGARRFPNDPRVFTELGSWLVLLERDVEAVEPLSRAVELRPLDPDCHVRLALAFIPSGAIDEAERLLRTAILLDPTHEQAHLKLAILLETNNRVSELEALLIDVEHRRVELGAVAFIAALVLRRQRKWNEVIARSLAIRPDVEPVRTAHMRGEAFDRLGEIDAAWDAFTEMNRQAILADLGAPLERASRYEAEVRGMIELMTPAWCAGWRHFENDRNDPVFLVGSPRSGTTLLDTMLMAHERVVVLEEQPILRKVAQAVGDLRRLPELEEEDIKSLRNIYFRELHSIMGGVGDRLIIDKFPLHLNRVALIHRVFPKARFIFAQRHPADVVLSTFITNFRLNYAMCNYLTIEQAAILYDACMSCWHRALELFPVDVHWVKYENIVMDQERELRKLIDFLGLDWSDELLDNQKTAVNRGSIKTASYSQVTEKIYQRGLDRWMGYGRHLKAVFPSIEPWINRMGYSPIDRNSL